MNLACIATLNRLLNRKQFICHCFNMQWPRSNRKSSCCFRDNKIAICISLYSIFFPLTSLLSSLNNGNILTTWNSYTGQYVWISFIGYFTNMNFALRRNGKVFHRCSCIFRNHSFFWNNMNIHCPYKIKSLGIPFSVLFNAFSVFIVN